MRLNTGVNDNLFDFTLHPSEKFMTPQAVITVGRNGLGEMSEISQKLVSNYILNSRIKQPLITLNTWEMSYLI